MYDPADLPPLRIPIGTWPVRPFSAPFNVLKDRRPIHPVYRKVPILLGGEAFAYRRMSQRVPSTSFSMKSRRIHGFCAVPITSAICAMTANSAARASSWCLTAWKTRSTRNKKRMKSMISSGRGISNSILPAMRQNRRKRLQAMLCLWTAVRASSDSGDNVTAGAPGGNTTMLKQVLVG